MVEAATERRKFDGVSPEDVVFGETLGEGKSQAFWKYNDVCRCLRTRQGWMAEI